MYKLAIQNFKIALTKLIAQNSNKDLKINNSNSKTFHGKNIRNFPKKLQEQHLKFYK